MASKKVIKLLNEQIANEGDSSQIYLAMAVWAEANGFMGTAKFMFRQAEEERGHAFKIIRFLLELGEKAEVPAVKEPKESYKDIQEVFDVALKHEQFITASIYKIMSEARESNDYAVTSFLQWFVNEQVEEEANVKQVLDIIRLAGKVSLYLADKEIGAFGAGK